MADSPKTDRQRAELEEETRLGWKMAGLAFTTASEAAAGALIGWIVDHVAGTAPTGLLIGAITGIFVGLVSLIRGAYKMNQLLSKQDLKRIKPLPPDDQDEQSTDDWKN